VSTAKMKAKQFFQLGDDPPGVRLELVNGEVAVSPSPIPDHGYAVLKLSYLLVRHLEEHELGEINLDIDTLLDDYNVRRPDLLYYSNARLHLIGEKHMEGPPDLAIEVISPSSVEVDREDKFEQYRVAKVKYYWIVDPALQTLEGWELRRRKYVAVGRAQGNKTICLPPFLDLEIPLKNLWRKKPSNA
jgi:Uma2 family endonuclease